MRTAEMSYCAAVRALREQLGLEVPQEQVEFWFSCHLNRGKCNEVVDVHALVQRDDAPAIRVRLDRKLERPSNGCIFAMPSVKVATRSSSTIPRSTVA